MLAGDVIITDVVHAFVVAVTPLVAGSGLPTPERLVIGNLWNAVAMALGRLFGALG